MTFSNNIAIVVGGYNSSNTSHLVELLEQKFPTYYISDVSEIENEQLINQLGISCDYWLFAH